MARELRPDIITFAKGAGGVGIPVAGVVMRKELDVLESWEHSTTSGANPLALAALEATITYINEHGVLDNVRRMGLLLVTGLRRLADRFSAVTHVRGEGLMLAFDLPDPAAVARLITVGKDNGLLLRGSRYGFGRTVKVRPPLIVTEADVVEILERLGSALSQWEKETR